MKKLYLLLTLVYLLFCLDSCGKKEGFELAGELEEVASDTLLVFFNAGEPKLDTLLLDGGKFNYTFSPDTVQPFTLFDKKGNILPLFAGKGWQIVLKGSLSRPQVTCGGVLPEYEAYFKLLGDYMAGQATLKEVEGFIRSHPDSYASAYLIDRCFVQTSAPDVEKIRGLINPLRGDVKDTPIISNILQVISRQDDDDGRKDRYLNYFSCRDRAGKYISWGDKNHKYTLVNFWASWDEASCVARDSLLKEAARLPKGTLKLLNLSLDYEKNAWLKASKKDTEQWVEVCDFTGWENSLIKQLHIMRIPANVLIDRNRKVLGMNLYGEQLHSRMLQLVEEDKHKK